MQIKCATQVLEMYKSFIKSFYKNECEAVKKLKRKCENAKWNDSVYDEVVNELNDVLSKIASAIAQLTDGNKVRMLDELIPVLEQYVQTKNRYPQ